MKLKELKTCSCGRVHSEIPESSKYLGEISELRGWYWNCQCGSTLFIAESSMTRFRHTPGPWKTERDGTPVIGGQISMTIENCGPDTASREELKANASLIAAAPELLESLKAAVKMHGNHCGCGFCLVAVPRIAKAEGEAA